MSDIRTSHFVEQAPLSAGATPYDDHLLMIDRLAPACASKIEALHIEHYYARHDVISVAFETTIRNPDGTSERLVCEPVNYTGWFLNTTPFFITDLDTGFDMKGQKIKPSVFITGNGFRPHPICSTFLTQRERGVTLFPSLTQLVDVHQELLRILI